MGFVTFRLLASALGRRYRNAGPGFRAAPETIMLGVRPGVAPSGKPPVRIFLGTEPAQFRAERVFVWSIEQVRDPSRIYEIHLMKNLAGFDRQLWLTGFTNYRFAIPHLAGRTGRAIYNDVDQIYLTDPAVLFDTDMDGHGYLSVSDADTSVMLIDCDRMAEIWPLNAVKRERRKQLEARARAVPGLWGALDPGWNARDEEYEPGRTGVLHFTTLHTQPWRPLPEEYVYRENPVGEIWHALERGADAAGFLPFDAAHPTEAYRTLRQRIGASAAEALEFLPDEDTLWALDRMFRSAREAVRIRVSACPAPLRLEDGTVIRGEPRSADWWRRRVAMVGAWHPGTAWELTVAGCGPLGGAERTFRGGRRLNDAPAVWVLASEKAGHTSQAIGLAEALGWPYQVKDVRLQSRDYLRPDLAERMLARLGLGKADAPPRWPDLVIASGWLPGRVARLLRRRSEGRTRVVALGRKGGPVRDAGEVAVTLAHFGLMPHPRRIEAVLPPNQVTPERLDEAARRWPDLLADLPQPRVVLLVGGTAKFHRLDAATAARMAREALDRTKAAGGALTVVTSRRTGEAATAALRAALGDAARLHEWRPDETENPYLAYLAQADILIVTGESESMLAEAVSAGKPVYIYPLPETPPTAAQRLGAWVARQATTARINKRGTPRPQQGLEYLCARLIERGWALPPRNIRAMHDNAVRLGVARMFGEPLQRWNRPACNPTQDVAERVRALLDAPAARPQPRGAPLRDQPA